MSIPWLSVSVLRRSLDQDEEQTPSTLHDDPEADDPDRAAPPRMSTRSRLRIDMPPTIAAPFTLAQNRTPGWETPWTSAHPNMSDSVDGHMHPGGRDSHHGDEKQTSWQRRRKRLRAYMMYNVYVPLVRLCVNLISMFLSSSIRGSSFSGCATLSSQRLRLPSPSVSGSLSSMRALLAHWGHLRAFLIHIRRKRSTESSLPRTVVIIFATLTLVHVMIAIYVCVPRTHATPFTLLT